MSAATFAPGTRVRHTLKGITGTVLARDDDAVDGYLRRGYTDFVPVQWDSDDAWLTNPDYLEGLRNVQTLPAANSPQEPEKTANDGGTTERSNTMSTTTFDLNEVRAGYTSRIREAIQETSGATIRSAARAMGMAPITLSRRLNGRSGKAFNITELRALADHLGIDWLSFFPDEMPARDVPRVVGLTSGHAPS